MPVIRTVLRTVTSYRNVTRNVGPAGASSAGASVWIAETPPEDPAEYPLWWDSTDGVLKIYYEDVNSSQWVDATPGGGVSGDGAGITDPEAFREALDLNAAGINSIFEGESLEVDSVLLAADSALILVGSNELARNGSSLVLGDGTTYGGVRVVPRRTKGSWRGSASANPITLASGLAFSAREMVVGAIIRIRGTFGLVATGSLPAATYLGVVSTHTQSLVIGQGVLNGIELSGMSAAQGVVDLQIDVITLAIVSGVGYFGLDYTTQANFAGVLTKTVSGSVSQAIIAPYSADAEEVVAATSQNFVLQLHTASASGATYNVAWDLEYEVTLP